MANESKGSGSNGSSLLQVRMDPEDKRALRIASAMKGVSISEFVRSHIIPDAREIAGSALHRPLPDSQ